MSGKSRRELRRLPEMLNNSARSNATANAMSSMSPSFSGAVAWLRRHRDQLNITLQLIRMYPNLIQDSCLDGFWDFLQEIVQAERDSEENTSDILQENLSSSMSHANEQDAFPVRVFPPTPGLNRHRPAPSVYLCTQNLKDGNFMQDATVNTLLKSLLQMVYVKVCKSGRSDETEFILSSDVFLFILNEANLSDKSCIDRLSVAVRKNIPVIMVRDPGYTLPESLPDFINDMEPFVRTFSSSETNQQVNVGDIDISVNTSGKDCLIKSDTERCENQKTVFSQPHPRADNLDMKMTLGEVIKDGYSNSVVFSVDFQHISIANLHSALSEYVSVFRNETETSTKTYDKGDNHGHPNEKLFVQNKSMNTNPSLSASKKQKLHGNSKTNTNITTRTTDFSKNSNPLHNKQIVNKQSIKASHLPPIEGKRIEISPVIPQQVRKPLQISKEIAINDVNNIMSLERMLSPQKLKEPKETIYLLFPKPMSAKRNPEVVRWPPKADEDMEIRNNYEMLNLQSASESPVSFDHLGDVPDVSLLDSSSPELE